MNNPPTSELNESTSTIQSFKINAFTNPHQHYAFSPTTTPNNKKQLTRALTEDYETSETRQQHPPAKTRYNNAKMLQRYANNTKPVILQKTVRKSSENPFRNQNSLKTPINGTQTVRQRSTTLPKQNLFSKKELAKQIQGVTIGGQRENTGGLAPPSVGGEQRSGIVGHKLLIEKNDEVEIRHEMAQSVISIINANEKLLLDSTKRLNKFLNEGQIDRSSDTSLLLTNVRADWVDRMKNIARIFRKIELVNKKQMADDLRDLVMKTPESFDRSVRFTAEQEHNLRR